MTDITVNQAASTPLPATLAPKPNKILTVSGKNRVAIDAMVWEGLTRKQAAEAAGLKDYSLYIALSKPHVKAYYMKQLDVLRTSERARNIHTLVEVRDQKTNQMARVVAVKAMEQLDDVQQSARAQSVPGLQIVIVQGGGQGSLSVQQQPSALTIEHGSDIVTDASD